MGHIAAGCLPRTEQHACLKMQTPWGDRFKNCTVLEQTLIRAPEATDAVEAVVLSPIDQNPATVFIAVSGSLLYTDSIPRKTLTRAAHELLAKYPILGGRYRSDEELLRVDCNNAGFPLSFATWPEGSLASFPGALTFKGWATKTPSKLPMPFYVDEVEGFGAVFQDEPLLRLRLTELGGDGGCILSLAINHGICGGAQTVSLLKDLAKACRGEALEPLSNGLSRGLLTAEGLSAAVPMLQPIIDSVSASISAEGEKNTETCFQQAWETVYGYGHGSVPSWQTSDQYSNVASAVLDIPKSDLAALKRKLMAGTDLQLSTNDVLVAIMWIVRSAIAGDPLPGQPGSEKYLALTTIDFAANSFPEILKDYFGNTITAFSVRVPPPTEGSDGAAESNGAEVDADALIKAAGMVATANRQALKGFRSGQDLLPFLKGLMAPNRLRKFKELRDGTAASGMRMISMLSNLILWTEADLEKFNCGEGAPLEAYILFDRATRVTLAVPCKDSKTIRLVAFMPSDAEEQLARAGVLEALVPNARFVWEKDTAQPPNEHHSVVEPPVKANLLSSHA